MILDLSQDISYIIIVYTKVYKYKSTFKVNYKLYKKVLKCY